MADSYHIIDGKVVPYCGGRKCNDTDAWRDATQLELQLQEQLEEYEHTIATLQDEVERLRELCGMAYQLAGVHDAPEKWLDALSNAASGRPFSTDGLLPYMPQAVCNAETRALELEREIEALREEVERLRANRDGWEQHASDRAADWHAEYLRAERLADALRELVDVISESGMYDEEVFDKARDALEQEPTT